ncbi:unnamed protein product, partial [Ascophyllum nodosum]
MINVPNKCRNEGCFEQSWFGVAGTKTAKYCAQHASGGIIKVRKSGKHANVEEYRRRKVDPHHSTEETVVNAGRCGAKKKTVHPSANASAPPNDGGDSRKRARQLDIASVASTRVIAVESAAVTATLSGIGRQQSPVTRD